MDSRREARERWRPFRPDPHPDPGGFWTVCRARLFNSAIDELIPARNRGQIDITINGSYWLGSAIGGMAALWFLDTSVFARDSGGGGRSE